MAEVTLKRGLEEKVSSLDKKDGQVIVTTDTGRIYIDYDKDSNIMRKALYPGRLLIGDYIFDGTKDILIPTYEGDIEEDEEESLLTLTSSNNDIETAQLLDDSNTATLLTETNNEIISTSSEDTVMTLSTDETQLTLIDDTQQLSAENQMEIS